MTDFKETVDFKKLAELIAPEKHLCIKCKQQLARTGIICDNCIKKLVNMIAEFGVTKKEKE
jgi:predicted amidophosphoribosyltransferase